MPSEVTTVPNVEILQTGEWDTSSGKFTWTLEDLAAAVEAQDDPALRAPIIKLGHTDPRFDGEPSLGRVENLRVDGQSLYGDLVGVPTWLADAMESAYPSRSIEGYFGLKTSTGTKHRFALTALALLGVTIPAIESLEDVKALYDASETDAVAAGKATAERAITVTFEERPMPRRVAASVNMDQVRTAFYDALPDGSWTWIREVWSDFLIVENDEGEIYQVPWSGDTADGITFGEPIEVVVQYVPAPPDAEDEGEDAMAVLMARYAPQNDANAHASFVRPTGRLRGPRHTVSASGPQGRPTNGGTMPLTNEQLTALGLAEDATPEQITEALVAAGEYATAERDALRAQLEQSDDTETPAVPDLPEGVTVIDEGTLADLVAAAGEGRSANATLRRQERDTLMGEAVKAGKFPPARRAHFEALYEADPEGTKALVAKLAAGTVPVSEIGHANGGSDDDNDAFFQKIAPGFVELERAAQQ